MQIDPHINRITGRNNNTCNYFWYNIYSEENSKLSQWGRCSSYSTLMCCPCSLVFSVEMGALGTYLLVLLQHRVPERQSHYLWLRRGRDFSGRGTRSYVPLFPENTYGDMAKRNIKRHYSSQIHMKFLNFWDMCCGLMKQSKVFNHFITISFWRTIRTFASHAYLKTW